MEIQMKNVKKIKISLLAARAISKLNRTFLERWAKEAFEQPRPLFKGK